MPERAYSTFEIKSVDDEQRLIEGIASTPELDRGGDEMDPKGAKFVLPMPLKWQHKAAVGRVIAATVTASGIRIKAVLPRIDEPGLLKEQVDYAWQSIKFGLTRGLSIGWRPLEATPNGKGGLKVATWEWFETSAVDIPMNASATIAIIKSFDRDSQTALRAADPLSAGVPASRRPAGSPGSVMKNVNEQIAELQSTRTKTAERMTAIYDPVLKGEGDLTPEQQKEYDGLVTALEQTDTQLDRLSALERAQAGNQNLTGITGHQHKGASQSRGGYAHVSVSEPDLPPGILYTRAVIAQMAARKEFRPAWDIAKQRWPSHPSIQAYLKTTITGGTTTGTGSGSPQTGWGDDLAALNTNFTAGFMDFLRPRTIVGRLNLKATPFNVRIQSQTTGGSARWVGQTKLKPVTKYDFDAITLGFAKLSAICVLAEELIRFSTPSAETVVRDQLTKTIVEKVDKDFIDPDVAAVANVSPASITRGITVLNPSGTNLAAVNTDIATIIGTFITANQNLDNLAWIMPSSTALALSMMLNSLGQPAFPQMTVKGGTLAGYPVVASQYAYNISTSPTDGNIVILLNQDEIFLADDGGVNIDASDQASIEMSDDPETDSGNVMVSMYQTNQVALRAERFINWARGRTSSVAVMGDVRWAA